MCTRTCKLKIYQTIGYTAGIVVGLAGLALNFMFTANDLVQQQSPYLVSVDVAAMKMHTTFNDLSAIRYDGNNFVLYGETPWQIQGGTDNLGNHWNAQQVMDFLAGVAGHLHAE